MEFDAPKDENNKVLVKNIQFTFDVEKSDDR